MGSSCCCNISNNTDERYVAIARDCRCVRLELLKILELISNAFTARLLMPTSSQNVWDAKLGSMGLLWGMHASRVLWISLWSTTCDHIDWRQALRMINFKPSPRQRLRRRAAVIMTSDRNELVASAAAMGAFGTYFSHMSTSLCAILLLSRAPHETIWTAARWAASLRMLATGVRAETINNPDKCVWDTLIMRPSTSLLFWMDVFEKFAAVKVILAWRDALRTGTGYSSSWRTPYTANNIWIVAASSWDVWFKGEIDRKDIGSIFAWSSPFIPTIFVYSASAFSV